MEKIHIRIDLLEHVGFGVKRAYTKIQTISDVWTPILNHWCLADIFRRVGHWNNLLLLKRHLSMLDLRAFYNGTVTDLCPMSVCTIVLDSIIADLSAHHSSRCPRWNLTAEITAHNRTWRHIWIQKLSEAGVNQAISTIQHITSDWNKTHGILILIFEPELSCLSHVQCLFPIVERTFRSCFFKMNCIISCVRQSTCGFVFHTLNIQLTPMKAHR